MKAILTTIKVSTLALALAFTGCDKKETPKEGTSSEAPAKDTHASVTKDLLKEIDAVSAAADSAKDAASAAAAKVKLDASAANLKAIAGRMTKLGKPDDAAKESMKADGEKLFMSFAKMDDIEKRLQADPALKPALDGFNNVGESMKAVMTAGM